MANLKNAISCILIFLVFVLGNQCTSREHLHTKILVITGGHSYDTADFIQMFYSMEGIEFNMAEKPDAWKILESGEEVDVLVFYDMWQDISEQEKKVFLAEFGKGTGMVFLHHSLVSHQEWPEYPQLVGGRFHQPRYTADSNRYSGFMHDLDLHVEVLDREHPVTEGIRDFNILDEGYKNTSRLSAVHPILQTDHPHCDPVIVWTHEVRHSRVVYLMGGHDRHAFGNKSFRRLIGNAIAWTAGKE